jgi:hypothetical protein
MESIYRNRWLHFKIIFSSAGNWALLCAFIMVLIMGLIKIYSPDLGFHLRSAQWMLDNKKFIYTDSFDYGSTDNRYYNLQWLYQLFVYALYRCGESVLVIANALLITSSMLLVGYRFSKSTIVESTKTRFGLFAIMLILFVQPLTFEVRPHVLSWIFLNLVLLVLEEYKRGKDKALFALPFLMLFWANTHSLAILGLATIAIYTAGIFFEKGKLDKKLFLFSMLSFAVFLINPYFINGLIYPFTQFGLISGNSLVKAYFGELQSPFSAKEISVLGTKYFTSPLLIVHLSALITIFSIVRSVLKKQYTDALLMTAYLIILNLAIKNYGYYIMLCLPLSVKYISEWLAIRNAGTIKQRMSSAKKTAAPVQAAFSSKKLYNRFAFAAITISIVISITSVTDGYAIFRHSPYRFGFIEDKDQLPVEATAFLNKNNIKGRLLNHLDFGGYLMAHYPEKVFIDGRMDVLPEDFFSKYYESLTLKNGIKKLINEYDPDIVIFPYVKASTWWEYFIVNKLKCGYRPVYADGLSVIYLKLSLYPQLHEVTGKSILEKLEPAAVQKLPEYIELSKPKGLMVLFNGLWQQQTFSIADQNKAIYCFTNGFDTAALHFSAMGISNSTVHTPNIYKNLAVYYQDKKMLNEAELCEDQSE